MPIELLAPTNYQDTIVMFKGESQYNLLPEFLTELSSAFTDLGYKVATIDMFDTDWPNRLFKIIKTKRIKFFMSMNGNGNDIMLNGKRLDGHTDAPMFNFFVDHPCGLIDRIDCSLNNLIVSCVDKTHVHFLEIYAQTRKPIQKYFVAHGGGASRNKAKERTIGERSIDVLFSGSYTDPESIRKSWLSSSIGSLLDIIAEAALYESEKSLVQVFIEAFESRGLNPAILKDRGSWCLLRAVGSYVRQARRKLIVESLRDCNMHIYGNGWEELPALANSNIRVCGQINYSEIYDKMADTKIVLNILPYFTDGSHERIFNSMLAGAVCLSDENIYLKDNFCCGKNIVLYNLKNNNAAEKIERLLGNTNMMDEIARNGKELALTDHTWRNRAEEILQIVVGRQ
ncbi:hypothetical protein GURASL_33520 [Geotalea uraniireducens]|uniref:Spore protein YkvP/CgeB glycosyl transferase-like domain-containing protein n=1 Tax=Geotalea uraniireducens TaxID=351604 RepID=A0ABN6VY47_9BACT|nr:glycosyltransferase [Geotalea uraniireducens]BDV44429.1 hypothetical protein GURASL_33520 [Geotalea uraniireducens]